MKNLLLSFLLLSGLSTAQSETVTVNKKVVCAASEVAFRALSEAKPTEKAFWIGTSGNSRYAMIVDDKTGTWTLLQFNADMACVIGIGTDHTAATAESK